QFERRLRRTAALSFRWKSASIKRYYMLARLNYISYEYKRGNRAFAPKAYIQQTRFFAQGLRKTSAEDGNRLYRKEMYIRVSFDYRSLPLKYYVICKNYRVAGYLYFFWQIQCIGEVSPMQRLFFISRLMHLGHRSKRCLQAFSPSVAQQFVGIEWHTLFREQLM